ncbi:MAG: hypothetical protein Q4A74_04600 [Cardiobacteriaceae bacterium]|nr:hypothetical protein [Cardiobacteriaceae bacterium]
METLFTSIIATFCFLLGNYFYSNQTESDLTENTETTVQDTASDNPNADEDDAQIAKPDTIISALPDELMYAEKAAKINLEYSPTEKQTIYFNANGEKSDHPENNGYYREVLGKTEDGRIVAQDYYQNDNKPQTAPFIIVKDADIGDFSNAVTDSKVVWYRPNNSIYAVQDFHDGKATSRMNIYENGILAAQMERPEDVNEDDPYIAVGAMSAGLRLFYPDGKLLSIAYTDDYQYIEYLYRPDGTPILASHMNLQTGLRNFGTWDDAGNPVEQNAISQALKPLQERQEHLFDMIEKDGFGNAEGTEADQAANTAVHNDIALPETIVATLPDNVLHADKAAENNIDYAPIDKQVIYFTAESENSKNPVEDGYYREVIGKTADGRYVAQDFYQTNSKPQTAPFILMQNADLKDFSTNNMDSKNIWYSQDGSIFAIEDFYQGKESSRLNVYEKGILAIQWPREKWVNEDDPYATALGNMSDGMRMFYPDGKLLSVAYSDDKQYAENIYRPNGTPIYAIRINKDGNHETVAVWDENGTALDPEKAIEDGIIKSQVERQNHLNDLMLTNDTIMPN